MKKQKKQKIVNIWNKVKKPLMILSIIGNVLFLMFIIIGCVGSHKKATQTSAINQMDWNTDLYTLRNTTWELNEVIEPTALITDYDNSSSWGTYYLHYKINDDRLNEDINWYGITFRSFPGGYFYIQLLAEDEGVTSQTNWAYGYNGSVTWYYSREIHFYTDKPSYSLSLPYESYENKTLIDWLFGYANLLEAERYHFDFVEQFNYNAYDDVSLSSYFVPKFWNTEDVKDYHTIRVDFLSSGKIWTNINLYFYNGLGKKYLVDNGELLTNNGASAFYSYMEYYNIDTGERVTVNVRKSGFIDGNNYIEIGSNWVNDAYQHLYIFDAREDIDYITNFNNSAYGASFVTPYYIGNYGNSAGIEQSFILLSQAFEGIKNILSIQILPNISLGLFLFLPLIVGVILTIIWVVKR